LAVVALICAAVPTLLFRVNLRHYRPPPQPCRTGFQPVRVPDRLETYPTRVSVLIPARNEERCIVAAVESALASTDVEVEVIVLDDGSEDRTAELVRAIAVR